jgi:xanthine dehydrogenase accessory factor
MRSVLEIVEAWVERGDPVALATVVDTKRSAPQPIGTKMAINGVEQVCGAVSGGCVEGAVVEVAERVLAGEAPPQLLTYGIADDEAWDVGLPCGGEITVWVQEYSREGLEGRFTALGREGVRAALVTVVGGDAKLGEKLLVQAGHPPLGTLGAGPGLDASASELAQDAMWAEQGGLREVEGATLFIDVIAPPPKLVIVGAVDFAAQLCEVAAIAGWRAFVVDPRARFATPERFPAAERVIAAWPDEAFAQLEDFDTATAIAVLTHDPKLDDAALIAAIGSNAGYIGAMGSRRAQANRRDRLLAAGMTEEQLERISAPIGLDLGALGAGETALSIMSEIVALRRGHTGGRLIGASGRIHDAVPA